MSKGYLSEGHNKSMRRKKIFGQRWGKGRLSLALVKCPDMLVIVGHILLSDVRKIVEIRVGK